MESCNPNDARFAHIPYVHRRTIGFAFGRVLGTAKNPPLETTMTEGAEGAFRLDWQLQNDKQDDKDAPEGDTGWLEFLPLNGLTLPITTKATEKQSLLHIWCVPIAANRSRMLMVNRRNFGQFNPLLSLFNLLTPVILQEDRRIMDTASPSEVPPIGAEVFIPSDTSTIAFSRYYEKHFLNQRANLIAVNLGD